MAGLSKKVSSVFYIASVIYVGVVLYLVLFYGKRDVITTRHINLEFFSAKKFYLDKYHESRLYRHQKKFIFEELFGNILIFLPFAFAMECLLKKRVSNRVIVVSALVSSLAIETLQYIFKRGTFDVDDIVLNTAGAMLGLLIYRLLLKLHIKA